MSPDALRKFAEAARLDAAGDYRSAEALLSAAVAAHPNWPEGLLNLGVARKRCGDWYGAISAMRAAQSLAPGDPTIAYNLGVALLDLGHYEEGLALFERRSDVPGLRLSKPNLPFPEWRGEGLDGKRLTIWPDQGFGDQIQSARFIPTLAAHGAEITLICAPALADLFEHSLGIRVVPAKGAIEFPDPDFWVLGLSLAYYLGIRTDSIPSDPYLTSPKTKFTGSRIGMVTTGSKHHPNDINRSMDELATDRLKNALINAIDLNPERTGATNFAETAAIIAGLDLVVTVDTSIAHLAGAMGKPVWIMLPYRGTDWRWMRNRTDSPWYPSAKLFRQEAPGDWNSVIGKIVEDLISHQIQLTSNAL